MPLFFSFFFLTFLALHLSFSLTFSLSVGLWNVMTAVVKCTRFVSFITTPYGRQVEPSCLHTHTKHSDITPHLIQSYMKNFRREGRPFTDTTDRDKWKHEKQSSLSCSPLSSALCVKVALKRLIRHEKRTSTRPKVSGVSKKRGGAHLQPSLIGASVHVCPPPPLPLLRLTFIFMF